MVGILSMWYNYILLQHFLRESMRFLLDTPPESFQCEMEVAICMCECQNKILFLQRSPQKPQGGSWSAPGGKIEKNEAATDAVRREVHEETGIVLHENELTHHGKYYIVTKEVQFIMHIFQAKFSEFPQIFLRLEEHQEYLWLSVAEALSLPLIFGADECIEKVYQNSLFQKSPHSF